MRRRLVALGLLVLSAALAAPRPASAQESVGDFRAKLSKWVDTQQLISQEQNEWEVEREELKATRDLLAQQKQILELEIKELEESNTQADDERRDLLLERGGYQRAANTLEEQLRAMEEGVLAVAPTLPQPLQDKLELLLVQIPEDPERAKLPLGQRLVNVLGVLAQTEKFNGTATFVGETRAVKGDKKVQIRTLYWGLGQAIYVDAQGEVAGVGRPAPEGGGSWEFVDDPDLVDEARLLLDIYEGNVDTIEFVRMPVEIR